MGLRCYTVHLSHQERKCEIIRKLRKCRSGSRAHEHNRHRSSFDSLTRESHLVCMHCLFEAPLQFSACQNKWLDESEEIRRLINNYIRRASEFSAYIHPINKHNESLGCAPGINYPALPAATHRQPWVYFIYTNTHILAGINMRSLVYPYMQAHIFKHFLTRSPPPPSARTTTMPRAASKVEH